MLWIFLAAHLSAISGDPDKLQSLFTADDVAVDLVGDGNVRRVGVRVTVDPTGVPRNCTAEFSSGVRKLDEYTCLIIMRRARFQPTLGPNGEPQFRVFRTEITWAVNASGGDAGADLDLTVTHLPTGLSDPTSVRLQFQVDEAGHPSDCRAEDGPAGDKSSADLLAIACDQLLRSYVATPATDAAGKPVRSLQDAVVRFSTKPRT